MTRFLVWLALLTSLYLIVLGSLRPWDLFTGVVIALSLLLLSGERPHKSNFGLGRLLAFPLFLGAVARSIIVGSWQVLLVASRLRPVGAPGLIELPIGDHSRLGVAVFALVVTLSPGSVVIDVNWERQVILVHLLNASHPEAEQRRLEAFYRSYQRPVFP